ncbi:MAG TPA: zinc-binding dehydrogenase [bacterium]|nr:zinc-binding dehydrogenase [bacterium]
MKSMAVVAFGEPLVPREVAMPLPRAGEVVVKVLACGVCRTDVKIVSGQMPFSHTQHLPHIPGHEIAGEIVSLGPGVSATLGQRVVVFNYWGCGRCPYCLAGQENLCDNLLGFVGFTTPGGFEEFLAVPASHVLPVPPNVTAVESAAMSCALGTGYHAVVTRGRVQAGETVVVLGAGGVGLHALQFARVAGCRIVAVDINQSKLDAARSIGTDEALLLQEAQPRVREMTGGRGADLVIDCVGNGEATQNALGLVRKGGRIVQVGYTTDATHFPRLPTDAVALREVSLIGARYITRPELARAIELVSRGLVRPVISDVMDFSQANEALARVRADEAVGRIVLQVAR